MITFLLITGILMQSTTFPDKGHDLSIKDVISILADWDVVHREQQPFYQPAYGISNFDSNPPTVWIFNTGDYASKRATVIHEFLHIYYHQLGIDTASPEGEEFIRGEEARLYLQIFGDASQANH